MSDCGERLGESKFGGLRYNDGKSKKEDSFYVGNVRGERNGIFLTGVMIERDCKTDYRISLKKLVRAASNMSKKQSSADAACKGKI